jgi:hypothetical protein
MIWFFVTVLVVTLALAVVQAAEQGRGLAIAMVATVVFFVAFAILAGISFLIAYSCGATEKALAGKDEPSSPFATDRLPEQVVPPRVVPND